MTLTLIRGCAFAAALTTSTLAFAQGASSPAQLAPNPGVGAPQPGSGIPSEVTTRGSGAGASVPTTGSIGQTGDDTIVIDRRDRRTMSGRGHNAGGGGGISDSSRNESGSAPR